MCHPIQSLTVGLSCSPGFCWPEWLVYSLLIHHEFIHMYMSIRRVFQVQQFPSSLSPDVRATRIPSCLQRLRVPGPLLARQDKILLSRRFPGLMQRFKDGS